MEALTRNLRGCCEGRCDVRVDLDHLVLLGGAGCVPHFDLLLDPIREDILEAGVGDVAEPPV